MNERNERMEKTLQSGKWISTFPLGYNPGGSISEPKSKIVIDVFEKYSKGNISLDDLSTYIYTTYNVLISKGGLHAMMINKFYIGIMIYQKNNYPHNYTTFISHDLFLKVKKTLKERRQNPKGEHTISQRRKDMKNQIFPLKNWESLKLERGEWIGSYPMGYATENKKKTKYSQCRDVFIHEKESQIIRDMFETYATGKHGVVSLCNYINGKYKTKLVKSAVHSKLKNRFYIGIMTWKGFDYPHRYPCLITQELFDVCQKVMAFNNKYSTYSFLGSNKNDVDTYIEEYSQDFKQLPPLEGILNLCKVKVRSLEDIMNFCELTLENAQSYLLELELDGKIKEIGPNMWETVT